MTKSPDGILRRLFLITFVFFGTSDSIYAHGQQLLAIPAFGTHILVTLLIGGLVSAWRIPLATRWKFFLLSLVVSFYLMALFVDWVIDKKYGIRLSILGGFLIPSLVASLFYFVIKLWRKNTGRVEQALSANDLHAPASRRHDSCGRRNRS